MRKLRHEAAARELTRQALKLTRSGARKEVFLNCVAHTIRLTDDGIELWSAERVCAAPRCANASEIQEMFLLYLNSTMSKDYPIHYET